MLALLAYLQSVSGVQGVLAAVSATQQAAEATTRQTQIISQRLLHNGEVDYARQRQSVRCPIRPTLNDTCKLASQARQNLCGRTKTTLR